MSSLEVLAPAHLRAEPFEIWSGRVLLGRGVDADLVLLDPTVSRRHALVRHFADHDEIEDLGSTGGTRVNGLPVAGPVRLVSGDVVQLARVQLRYVNEDQPADGGGAAEPVTAETSPVEMAEVRRWWPF
jgi:pSer/pThr/pTyr-binding forkhead associated (FHA) protein